MALADKQVKVVIGGDSSGAEKAFKDVNGSLGRLDNGFKGAMSAVTAFQGAIAAMGLSMMARDLLDAGIAFDKLKNSMAAASGSAEMGAIELGFVREEAARLGLDLQSTAEAYTKLAASSRGTSLEGQQTRDIFSALSEAATSLGLSGEEASGVFLAVSQMMAKGKVSAEELRGQIGERLPGAMRAAAESIRLPNESLEQASARLEDMMKKGELIATDFLPKFALAMKTEFPASEKAVHSLGAEVNRLKTSFFDLKTTIMDSGGNTIFTALISDTRTLFEEMDIGIQKVNNQTGFWNKLDALLNLTRRRGMGQFLPEEEKGAWDAPSNSRDPFSYTPEEIKKLQAQFVAREMGSSSGGRGGGGNKRPSWATPPTGRGFFSDAWDQSVMEEEFSRGQGTSFQTDLNYRMPGSPGPSLLGPGGLDGFLTQAATEKQAYLDQTEQMYQSQIELETMMYEQRQAGRLQDLKNEQAIAEARRQVGSNVTSSLMNFTNALYTFSGQKNRQLFELNKVAGIASTTISTYQLSVKAANETPGPWWVKLAAAASAFTFGMSNVARIASTDFGSGGSAPAGGSGGGTPDSPIVTQPINQTSQGPSITLVLQDSHFYGDRAHLDKWTEEELLPSIREAIGRSV